MLASTDPSALKTLGAGVSHLPWKMVIFAGFGAFTHWLVLRYGNHLDRGIDKFVGDITGPQLRRVTLNIFVFVSLGSILAVVMVGPSTIRQALAAGMAWTTLLGHGMAMGHGAKADV